MKFILNLALFIALFIVAVSALPQNKLRPIIPRLSAGSSRIINGSPADLGQFPYQTTVRFQTPQGGFFCGGSLISADWVLTAGHCAADATSFTIDLGIIDLQTPNVEVGVSEAIVHSGYDAFNLQNDIALLHLDATVEFNANIAAVALSNADIAGGQDVIVSGWGKTSDASSTVSQFLNWVDLQTMTNAECDSFYTGFIVDGMICCTSQGPVKSTCNGDSGGPLVIGEGAAAQHIGVVSFVSSLGCESGAPSGYTRTSFYRDWITQNSGV